MFVGQEQAYNIDYEEVIEIFKTLDPTVNKTYYHINHIKVVQIMFSYLLIIFIMYYVFLIYSV